MKFTREWGDNLHARNFVSVLFFLVENGCNGDCCGECDRKDKGFLTTKPQ